jgi:hypothetical protein
MTRTEFTIIVGRLITQMALEGDHPIIDYALRSDAEQLRLFNAGKSKCDGVHKRSRHQDGMAVDIYLLRNGSVEWDADKAELYHSMWENWGGKPVISWDQGHFEA